MRVTSVFVQCKKGRGPETKLWGKADFPRRPEEEDSTKIEKGQPEKRKMSGMSSKVGEAVGMQAAENKIIVSVQWV